MSSSIIVLNSTNITNLGNGNNTLVYNFPNSVDFPNHSIALQNLVTYYAWENINANFLINNTFTYGWTVGGVTTTYNVVIPNGLWEISTIDLYLQYLFIQRGQYLINATGDYVFYVRLVVNPQRYGVNIDTYPVPTSLPAGYSEPVAVPASGAAAWLGYPTTTYNPSVTILPTNFFYKIVGYVPGFTTSANTGVGTNLSHLSSTPPQVQPNPNMLVSVTNINNRYAGNGSTIYVATPNVGFGEVFTSTPSEYAYQKLLAGTYNSITVRLLGQDGSPLQVLDSNMTISLVIRNDSSVGGIINTQKG